MSRRHKMKLGEYVCITRGLVICCHDGCHTAAMTVWLLWVICHLEDPALKVHVCVGLLALHEGVKACPHSLQRLFRPRSFEDTANLLLYNQVQQHPMVRADVNRY